MDDAQALHEAVRQEDAARVAELLDRGVPVDVRGDSGVTPLMSAAGHETAAVVDLLLARGADPAARDDRGQTPLHHVCRRGMNSPLLALVLLDAGAPADARDADGFTPLDRAAAGGLINVQDVFVDADRLEGSSAATRLLVGARCGRDAAVERALAEVDIGSVADEHGCTPLWWAAWAGHAETVDRLLRAGADPNRASERGETALMRTPRAAVARLLLAHGADPHALTTLGRNALSFACERGRGDVVRALLEGGADADVGGARRPVYWLTEYGVRHDGAVDAMRALIAGEGVTPEDVLEQAARGRGQALRVLLQAGVVADLRDGEGATLLVHAITNRQLGAVEVLLDAGASPFTVARDGRSPLLLAREAGGEVAAAVEAAAARVPRSEVPVLAWAATVGDLALVRACLAAGAPPDGSADAFEVPLGLAAARGHVAVLEALLAAGPSVDRAEAMAGTTPLQVAAAYGQAGAARVLLAAGAAVEHSALGMRVGEEWALVGETALMMAARAGHAEVVDVLLAGGADPSRLSAAGLSARDLALAAGQADIAARLAERDG